MGEQTSQGAVLSTCMSKVFAFRVSGRRKGVQTRAARLSQ